MSRSRLPSVRRYRPPLRETLPGTTITPGACKGLGIHPPPSACPRCDCRSSPWSGDMSDSSDTLFSKIARGEIPSARVLETDLAFAFLDINPVNVGHILLIPKEPFATV